MRGAVTHSEVRGDRKSGEVNGVSDFSEVAPKRSNRVYDATLNYNYGYSMGYFVCYRGLTMLFKLRRIVFRIMSGVSLNGMATSD